MPVEPRPFAVRRFRTEPFPASEEERRDHFRRAAARTFGVIGATVALIAVVAALISIR